MWTTMKLEDVKKELGRHLQCKNSPLHGVTSLYGGPARLADLTCLSLCIPTNVFGVDDSTLPKKATKGDKVANAARNWDNATPSAAAMDTFFLYLEMNNWLHTVKVDRASATFRRRRIFESQ
jgi:hypothetical protein